MVSSPDAGRLDAALAGLDVMISIDNWLNETTRHADLILPGQSSLEQPHYDELIWNWSVRNAPTSPSRSSRLTPIVRPSGDPAAAGRHRGRDARGHRRRQGVRRRLLMGLVMAAASQPGSRIADRDPAEILAATPGNGPLRILDFSLRIGPWGEGYGADPEGSRSTDCVRAPTGSISARSSLVSTRCSVPSGRIELAHPHITADVPRLRARLERTDGDSLVLVSRRHLRSNNSWMHNVEVLVKGKTAARCW